MRGAISELLQVPIDAYVTIDMGDLSAMVDAVGGVEVNPHAPLVDKHVHLHMEPGRQQINGKTANGYVRTRFDTDYARAARQQEVLLQIVDKLVDPEADVDIPQLLGALHSFDTDLSLADMPTFVELARRAQGADITGQVLNPEDGFILDEGDFGDGRGYILIPDIEKMRRFRPAPPAGLMVTLVAGWGARRIRPPLPPAQRRHRAEVARGVEQRFRKPSVVGSNPTFGSPLAWPPLSGSRQHLVISLPAETLAGAPLVTRDKQRASAAGRSVAAGWS